jgi:hypothetical protein
VHREIGSSSGAGTLGVAGLGGGGVCRLQMMMMLEDVVSSLNSDFSSVLRKSIICNYITLLATRSTVLAVLIHGVLPS